MGGSSSPRRPAASAPPSLWFLATPSPCSCPSSRSRSCPHPDAPSVLRPVGLCHPVALGSSRLSAPPRLLSLFSVPVPVPCSLSSVVDPGQVVRRCSRPCSRSRSHPVLGLVPCSPADWSFSCARSRGSPPLLSVRPRSDAFGPLLFWSPPLSWCNGQALVRRQGSPRTGCAGRWGHDRLTPVCPQGSVETISCPFD